MTGKHLVTYLALWLLALAAHGGELVDIGGVIPEAVVDIRYHGADNFVGAPIDGYLKPRCLLTASAARALRRVQDSLREQGLGIKIFDCYRPQRAVDHFVRWARDLEDTRMKERYYPAVAKDQLFSQGYIAERSGHSRGSTLDLTLVRFAPDGAVELDMGTRYDFFDALSHTDNPAIIGEVRANRDLLRQAMAAQGFANLAEEWWHYTLADEPYPDTYFDLPIH